MTEREALQAQKDALVEQIRILDFEHETAKMPDDEYERQRTQLLREAAFILKRLDALVPASVEATNGSAARADREIEAAIAALRDPSLDVASLASASDAQIEAAVQRMRAEKPEGGASRRHSTNGDAQPAAKPQVAARFCPQCGNRRDPHDKFCAYCGFHFA
jgi:ribosomal protein L32